MSKLRKGRGLWLRITIVGCIVAGGLYFQLRSNASNTPTMPEGYTQTDGVTLATEPEPSAPAKIDRTLMELPEPSAEGHNYLVTHYADGRANYSLEYDAERRHARWVAFSFDKYSAQTNVRRSNAWAWDPSIPAKYSTDNWFARSGYTRGHLVASDDRIASHRTNAQTFYYSNISPQREEHNSGVWLHLEKKVQSWGRSNRFRDVLYVAKGGTIRDDQVEGRRLRGKMVVPRYYWMALLLKKGGEYHSIAFWTEHRAYTREESNLRGLAISVDELERRTGLNLFYNLPHSIAERIEAQDPNSPSSRRIWWGNER